MNRRVLRARIQADLVVTQAYEDATCSMVLTWPDAEGCLGVIAADAPHIALVEPTGLPIHRYCVPCARNLFAWPR